MVVTSTSANLCPRCGSTPDAGHRFCEECGLDLRARWAGTADAVIPRDPCATCDTPRPADGTDQGDGSGRGDEYCTTCGHRLPDGTDHVEIDLGTLAGVSDRGYVHARNEDAMALGLRTDTGTRVAVVCDGVSSSRNPQDASRAATDAALAVLLGLDPGTAAPAPVPDEERPPLPGRTVRIRPPAPGRDGPEQHDPAQDDEDDGSPGGLVRRAVAAAADAVAALSPDGGRDAPSCTLVTALVQESGATTIGWVGDSRAYWLPADPERARLLTRDHSWAAELVAAGVLDEEAAMRHPRAHAITRWLGTDGTRTPEVRRFTPDEPGLLLVCSDGLWNDLADASRLAALVAPCVGLPDAVGLLTRCALDAGGHDNITVVAIAIPGGEPA